MPAKLKPPDKRNPTCFGMPHAGFFKFFVWVNILQNFICIAIVVYEITITVQALQVLEVNPLDEQIKLYMRAFAWIWFIVHCIISFFLDHRLFRTAISPRISFLRIYSLIHCISLPLFSIWYYTLLIIGGSILPYPPILANVLLPGHVLYRMYTSYIVFRYSRDIDFDLKMKSGYRSLTDEEMELFEHGLSIADEKTKQKYYDSCYEMVQLQAYKRKEYEISREWLDFTEATTLGCGEYGCVYKVALDDKKKGVITIVAVKTVDPELSDVNQFKALLTEAKVMMCMGKHENVVNLIGICTDEIRELFHKIGTGKLYIVCELCEFGNLRAHLRSERNTFVNLSEQKQEGEVAINIDMENLSTFDLVKWCNDVANGMVFLSNRKIIHGDLATRNVLLISSKVAKITDFGLSRRLYNYSVYKKRHNVPLPWRWLALESLVDMHFSSSSDVWSYGVTCWEIFELGGRPWQDFQVFSSEFIDALKDGKILEKGEYCSDEIYNVMSSCWNKEPAERPSFEQLRAFFCRILEELHTTHKFSD